MAHNCSPKSSYLFQTKSVKIPMEIQGYSRAVTVLEPFPQVKWCTWRRHLQGSLPKLHQQLQRFDVSCLQQGHHCTRHSSGDQAIAGLAEADISETDMNRYDLMIWCFSYPEHIYILIWLGRHIFNLLSTFRYKLPI